LHSKSTGGPTVKLSPLQLTAFFYLIMGFYCFFFTSKIYLVIFFLLMICYKYRNILIRMIHRQVQNICWKTARSENIKNSSCEQMDLWTRGGHGVRITTQSLPWWLFNILVNIAINLSSLFVRKIESFLFFSSKLLNTNLGTSTTTNDESFVEKMMFVEQIRLWVASLKYL